MKKHGISRHLPSGFTLGFVALACTTLAAPSAKATLIAHWDFNENTGTTVTDSVSGNVGTFSGGGIEFSSTFAPRIGGGTSVSFSTANNQIVVPDSSSLSLTSDYSIAVWVRPIAPTAGEHRNIVAKDGNKAYRYRLNGAAGAQWMLLNDGSGPGGGFQVIDGSGATAVTDEAWNHIAVTTDFGAGELKYYLDGNLVQTLSVTETGIQDTGGSFLIGNYIPNSSESYRGLMDDLRIYDHVLSANEVKALAVVPEPSSFLGLLGLICGGSFVRRRRKLA